MIGPEPRPQKEQKDESGHQRDAFKLPGHVGLRPFLNRRLNLFHLRRSGIFFHYPAGEIKCVEDADACTDERE